MENLHKRFDSENLEHFFVLEGGGPFGIGYEAGILDELRSRGANGRGIHTLGTSAGSWVAGMMATGKTYEDVASQKQIKLFRKEQDYMLGYAKDVFGEERSPYVHATASELNDRWPKLRIWDGDEHDIAHMATMSSSVPYLFTPANYQGERYWDGAVAGISAGYAHMAPKAETLVCISALSTHLKLPVPGPLKYVAGSVLERKTRLELWRWQRRNPMSKVIYIRPSEEIGNVIETPKDIFDFEKAKRVYAMAREQMADMIDGSSRKPVRESVAKLALDLCRDKVA